jgi:hypothetical protein
MSISFLLETEVIDITIRVCVCGLCVCVCVVCVGVCVYVQ